jgi:hypothetical protein
VTRNGEVVNRGPIADFTTAQLSEAISGRQIRIERLQLPELLSVSHRILVMTAGKLSIQHSAQGLDLQALGLPDSQSQQDQSDHW